MYCAIKRVAHTLTSFKIPNLQNVDLKNRVFSSVSHVLGQASEMVYGVEEQQLPVEAEVEMPPIEEAAPTFADESAAEPAAGYDERT